MNTLILRSTLASLALALVCSCSTTAGHTHAANDQPQPQENSMLIQFLEIVTTDADATCEALAKVHGVSFSEPDAMLGGARTADLQSGGRLSVRAPMADHEGPVVRPYVLVTDIEAAVAAAEASGAEIAMASTEIPGQGKFAIYILGGIQHGLWQN